MTRPLDETCCVLRGSPCQAGTAFSFFLLLVFLSHSRNIRSLRHDTLTNAETRYPIFRRIILSVVFLLFRRAP